MSAMPLALLIQHEKAHSNESLKDTFFPECLVNESRCDICGKTFQTDNIDLGEDDGSVKNLIDTFE
jgi:hypothetical protein